MIVERITLGAIYKTLVQLEINEGKVYDIVLDYKIGDKVLSPPVFADLNALRVFINTQYPYIPMTEMAEICTWNTYRLVKFWINKDNGIQVQNKETVMVSKSTLFAISKKRLSDLNAYLTKVANYVDFDHYIGPSTPTYVEWVYINDVINENSFQKAALEYKKYTTT